MSASRSHRGLYDELYHYWQGEGPLWKLYWIYGVLLSSVGGAAILGAVIQGALPVPILIILLAVALIYTGYILISIWRSAFNIESDPLGIDRDAWAWLARVLTVGWALNAGGASLMLLEYAMGY